MVALPSLSPRALPTQPGQPIDLPIDLPPRLPHDRVARPPLAPHTDNTTPAAPAASPYGAPQPPAPPEHQQPDESEAAGEDAATYSPLLKDHVFALYCAGQRSPAIAAQLGIPERTARHWVHTSLQQLAQDDVTASPAAAREQRALAIECQRAASASAWATYHRLTAAHSQLLDLALMATIHSTPIGSDAPQPQADVGATTHDPQRLFITAARLASAAARYLALVISANREIAHLQGHVTAQDARERHATAARDAANARQLEADLIRSFTTPNLPPEPALARLSPYASWPGGITTPQPGLPAYTANRQPHPPVAPVAPVSPTILPTSAAKTATPLAAVQVAPHSEIAAKTATSPAPTAATPAVVLPLPAPGAAARATQAARGQGSRSQTPAKTKIAAKTATPTPHAVSKSPPPRPSASAKRGKPQLILSPKPQPTAAHLAARPLIS